MENFDYKPLVSIIVPVFNTDKYIVKCLNSVLEQTYNNIEIICIDDSSTDNSFQIIKNYADSDSRVKIIKNDCNIGAGLSRNLGVTVSNGEYLYFLDSDDWLKKEAIEILINILNKKGKVDFITFQHSYIDAKTKKIRYGLMFPDSISDKIIDLKSHPECVNYIQYEMTKFIKKSFLVDNDIKFNDSRSLEDVEYTLDILLSAKNLICTNKIIYNYMENRDNSVSSHAERYTETLIKAVEKVYAKTVNYDKHARAIIVMSLYKTLLYTSYKAYYHNVIDYKRFRNIFASVDDEILRDTNSQFYLSLRYKVLNYSPLHLKIETFPKMFLREYFPLFLDKCIEFRKNLKAKFKKSF